MSKRSESVSSGDIGRFVRSVMDLVTGNPIVEEPSPIKKDQEHRSRTSLKTPNKQPVRSSRSK